MPPAKKPANKAETAPVPRSAQKKPTPVEVSINYSIGTKVNIGNYESVDVHISESERYDVTGMSIVEVEEFWGERYIELNRRLGDLIIREKNEILGKDN